MTARPAPMQLSIPALFGWVVVSTLLAALAGLWPTWRWFGVAGFDAAALAASAMLPLLALSSLAVLAAASKGPAWAAFIFISVGMIRGIAAFGVTALMLHLTGLPPMALIGWMVGMYMACLAGETIWLARGLHHHAYRKALGDFDPPPADRREVRA